MDTFIITMFKKCGSQRTPNHTPKISCLAAGAVMTFFNLLPSPAFGYGVSKEPEFRSAPLSWTYEDKNYIPRNSREDAEKNKEKIGESSLWEKKLKFMDDFELGKYYICIIESGLKTDIIYKEIIYQITKLTQDERYAEAGYLVDKMLLNIPENKEIQKELHLTAGYVYILYAQELEEKEEHEDARINYVFASYHFGNADATDLRKRALDGVRRINEEIKIRDKNKQK